MAKKVASTVTLITAPGEFPAKFRVDGTPTAPDRMGWPDLRRAGKLAFPDHGAMVTSAGRDALLLALRTGKLPGTTTTTTTTTTPPTTTGGDEPTIATSGNGTGTTTTPTPTGGDGAGGDGLDTLRKLLIDSTALEARVRSIVDPIRHELEGMIAEKGVTVRVEYQDGTSRKIDGAHKMLPKILDIAIVRGHTYLYGGAGTGKTTLAHDAARALDLRFAFESFCPSKDDTVLLGFVDATGTYRGTLFRDYYENGGLFLFDEIDNCDPSILAVANAALANDRMAFPDGMVERHKDFVLVAAGNTYGSGPDATYIGRAPLDKATLDRFVHVHVPIDEDVERKAALACLPEADEEKGLRWIATVRRYRAAAESAGMNVVISPRASIMGCKLLSRGWSEAEIEHAVVFRGMDETTVRVIRKGAE